MSKRRVVVTGLGMLSPLGLTAEESWQNALAGKSGVCMIDRFDTTDFSVKFSGAVKNFDPNPYLDKKEQRKFDVFVQYAVATADQALADSGLNLENERLDRIGVAVGSGIGGLPFIEANTNVCRDTGPRRISPFFIPGSIVNMASGLISIRHGLQGPNYAIVTACTTGAHNIGFASRCIEYGDADIMVAGGAEMATSKLGVGGFAAMRALSTRNDEPEKASRPWDKDRDGFVLGDGAGVLILEAYEHAKARGATIYAELKGFGMSADAFHMTMPASEGSVRCMQNALASAGLNPDAVDYINAHATSTPAGDGAEATSVKTVFGEHASQLAMSGTKSMTAHLLGAAGAIEAIFSILSIRDNAVPPTINLDNPADECEGLNLVPNEAQQREVKVSLSNSFGFGGTNGSLVFAQL